MKFIFLCFTVILFVLSPGLAGAGSSSARVDLNADEIAPRAIEDLTRKSIIRDYGLAWQALRDALDHDRPEALDGYFTGFARDEFSRLIQSQKKTGVRVRYTDQSHKLTAIFYSPSGDALQLKDRATLETQIMDGSKVLRTEQTPRSYLVLMTPGADRWLVRDLETVPEGRP